MFNVNFIQLIKDLLPINLRQSKIIDFLTAMVKPLKDVSVSLSVYRDVVAYKLQFQGQKVYMEHYLNDKYDALNRQIYIENTATITYNYLWNKIEAQPPFYGYNNWQSATVYVAGEFCTFGVAGVGTHIYKALAGNTGKQPNLYPAAWEDVGSVTYFKNWEEYADEQEFIVWVPSAVYLAMDLNQFKADVNFYKPAGRRYKVMSF